MSHRITHTLLALAVLATFTRPCAADLLIDPTGGNIGVDASNFQTNSQISVDFGFTAPVAVSPGPVYGANGADGGRGQPRF